MREEEEQKEAGRKRGAATARELCRIALFAAIIAVCAWISVPIGEIPVTMQNLIR